MHASAHHVNVAELPHPSAPGDDAAKFAAWVLGELIALPSWQMFPGILTSAAAIICRWRQRFDKKQWTRLMKHGRMLKELNEIAPVIAETLRWVERTDTIVRAAPLHTALGYLI